MGDGDTVDAMGNKVSSVSKEELKKTEEDAEPGKSSNAACSSTSDHAAGDPAATVQSCPGVQDPDFAEELAELEKAGDSLAVIDEDVPDDDELELADGDPTVNMCLTMDSDTESKSVGSRKSSVSQKLENMEAVSSGDEDFFMSDEEKPASRRSSPARRLSTESITSIEDTTAVNKSTEREEAEKMQVPDTDIEKEPGKGSFVAPTSKLANIRGSSTSDIDSEDERRTTKFLSHAEGMRMKIRSMEDELDDIESEEGEYTEQDISTEVKEKETVSEHGEGDGEKKKGNVESSSSGEKAPGDEVPPESKEVISPVDAAPIEDEIMDIDDILGDNWEVVSETSGGEDDHLGDSAVEVPQKSVDKKSDLIEKDVEIEESSKVVEKIDEIVPKDGKEDSSKVDEKKEEIVESTLQGDDKDTTTPPESSRDVPTIPVSESDAILVDSDEEADEKKTSGDSSKLPAPISSTELSSNSNEEKTNDDKSSGPAPKPEIEKEMDVVEIMDSDDDKSRDGEKEGSKEDKGKESEKAIETLEKDTLKSSEDSAMEVDSATVGELEKPSEDGAIKTPELSILEVVSLEKEDLQIIPVDKTPTEETKAGDNDDKAVQSQKDNQEMDLDSKTEDTVPVSLQTVEKNIENAGDQDEGRNSAPGTESVPEEINSSPIEEIPTPTLKETPSLESQDPVTEEIPLDDAEIAPESISLRALDNLDDSNGREDNEDNLDFDTDLGDNDHPISLDDYFSDSPDSKKASDEKADENKSSHSIDMDVVHGGDDSNSCSSDRTDTNRNFKYESDKEEEPVAKSPAKKYSGECINPDCSHKKGTPNLFPAPAFARTYFNVKMRKAMRVKVCESCLDECISNYGSLWDKFEENGLDYSDVPLRDDLEVIGSSDEEDIEDLTETASTDNEKTEVEEEKEVPVGAEKASSEMSKFLEDNLESLLVEMQSKFKFQEKFQQFEESCERKLEEQSETLNQMSEQLNKIMNDVDGYCDALLDEVLPVHPTLVNAFAPPPVTHCSSISLGDECYGQWIPGYFRKAILLERTFDAANTPTYKLQFLPYGGKENVVRNLTGEQVATLKAPSRFHFGKRVVVIQQTDMNGAHSGMVADVTDKDTLILYEDGLVKYVSPYLMCPILVPFPNVRYASIVMDRHSKPMIKDMMALATVREYRLKVGDMVDIYHFSKWHTARVLAVEEAVALCGTKNKRRVMYTGSPHIRPISLCYAVTKRIRMDSPNQTLKTELYLSPQHQRQVLQRQQLQRQQQQQLQRQKMQQQHPHHITIDLGSSASDSGSAIERSPQQQPQPRQWKKKEAPPPRVQLPRAQSAQQKRTIIMQQMQVIRDPEDNERVVTAAAAARAAAAHERQVAKKSGSGYPGGSLGAQFADLTFPEEPPTPVAAAPEPILMSPASGDRTSRPRQAVSMPSQYYKQVKNMNNATIYLDEDDAKQGQIVSFVAPKKFSKSFVSHECGPQCTPDLISDLSKYNPLSQPLMAGWKRRIVTSNTKQKSIMYKAPCGRSLRNMNEVHFYLRATRSPFNVDLFEFEADVQCLAEYKVDQKAIKWQTMDLSEGREPMPISCVNYYDTTLPPTCEYSTERTPTEGVNLNLSEEFLACCDCEDDCLDKEKCQCWQLTIQGERVRDPDLYELDVGYVYKRLPNPVPTGIYECNPRCRCSKSCLNRVVQHKIQLKLQVYKTANRGWGIRCLNDVPKGGFICVYAGHLLTEQRANEAGENEGDEYFAELDYIEVAERLKAGYESDLPEDWQSDLESSSDDSMDIDDEDYRYNIGYQSERKRMTRQKNAPKRKKPRMVPLRKLFGQNEEIYVMDAKVAGNIGRYFNHSCAPNLFVQNVFVDTHDLRFPWVSFFALHNIRAGTELTWNYNYEVGSVQGKILICQCGSKSCRGRIL